MSSINMTNIPCLSVGELVDTISGGYARIIKQGMPLSTMPSIMLWSPPGVGKSQSVEEFAERLRKCTGKKVIVIDVRLLMFNPVDLRGIPTVNEDKTLAVWLKPKIFQMDDADDVINILFLDEISAAPPSVQAAAYQITLDRTVGEHKLPDNCIVIAAGNRTTDKSVSFKMPKALANRLMHIEVESNFDSWKAWAVKNAINSKVIGFISFQRSRLMGFDATNDDLAFPTPRSWEMVSNILNFVEPDMEKAFPLIAGLIGTGVATEFLTWCEVYNELPKIEDIFAGKCCVVPKSPGGLYAVESSMVAYAREHLRNMSGIANSLQYAENFPPDYILILIKDYIGLDEDISWKLLKMPEFSSKLRKVGRILNATH